MYSVQEVPEFFLTACTHTVQYGQKQLIMRLDARADWSTFHFSAFAVNTYDTPMSLLHCPAGRSNIGILRLIDATLTELCEPFGCRRMQVRVMET